MTDADQAKKFVQLFAKSEPALRAFSYSLLLSWTDADDIVQATAMVAWEKFETFEEGTDFLAWASRIAKYEVLMLRRTRGRSPLRFSSDFVEAVAEETAAGSAEFSNRNSALAECIGEIAPRHRRLIELRYRDGLSAGEIAKELGKSIEAIYKATLRVRASLVECVERKLSRGAAR